MSTDEKMKNIDTGTETDKFPCPECDFGVTVTNGNWHVCMRCQHEWYTEEKEASWKSPLQELKEGHIE